MPSTAARRLTGYEGRGSAASGQCHSVAELVPSRDDDRYTASITVAFGRTYGAMRRRLDEVGGVGAGRSFREVAELQRSILRLAPVPPIADLEVLNYVSRARLTILASRDSNSGSVVRSPAVQPPLARDWPRHGAWVIYGLDLSGAGI